MEPSRQHLATFPRRRGWIVITRADIDDRVRLWGLREDVVEKHYVLGWVLWGIGADPLLHQTWVFKGGTCLKKCYIETFRFSEDLDFTVLEHGPIEQGEALEAISRVLDRVNQESGIDFALRPPAYRARSSGRSAEMRVYYRGPRNTPGPAGIKFDLTKDETIARPSVLSTQHVGEHMRSEFPTRVSYTGCSTKLGHNFPFPRWQWRHGRSTVHHSRQFLETGNWQLQFSGTVGPAALPCAGGVPPQRPPDTPPPAAGCGF